MVDVIYLNEKKIHIYIYIYIMYLHVSLHACIHTYVRTYKRIVVSCVEGMWLPQPSISHWIWPFKALTNPLFSIWDGYRPGLAYSS